MNPVKPGPIKHRRKITGMSAVLVPFKTDHEVDWAAFDTHVERTLEADLIPAVNMDTGYVNLLDENSKSEVLQRTQRITAAPSSALPPSTFRRKAAENADF